MHSRAEWLQKRRQLAWERGRQLQSDLLTRFATTYGYSTTPPPAKIGDEVITDILGAELRFDPLPANVFAHTEWVRGRPRVTINSRTADIRGVRDAEGVQNVAKWHEIIHLVDDAEVVRTDLQGLLPGFQGSRIICYRKPEAHLSSSALSREFWAEEAGRAAAVSHEALSRSDAFRELLDLGARAHGPVRQGWPLLYKAAGDIGVNISSLVKQLTLEGAIAIAGKNDVVVQPRLPEVREVG